MRFDSKTDKLPRLTDAMADWPADAQAEVLSQLAQIDRRSAKRERAARQKSSRTNA